jgi:hypothetical protein
MQKLVRLARGRQQAQFLRESLAASPKIYSYLTKLFTFNLHIWGEQDAHP